MEVVVRADAAFTKPDFYEALEGGAVYTACYVAIQNANPGQLL